MKLLASLSLLLVAMAQGQLELTPIKIGLEWFLNPDHLPLVVALKEGYFADAGLDVSLVEPADHWEAEEEIIAGRLDVAVTETLHLAQDAAKGKPVVGFSRFLHTDGGVMFLKGKGIERPSDMCGKTISYPGYPGPGGPAIVGTMVKADEGDCKGKPFGKHDGSFYHVDALVGGADVATLIFSNFEMVEAKSRGLDAGFFSLKDWGVPGPSRGVLVGAFRLALETSAMLLIGSTPRHRSAILSSASPLDPRRFLPASFIHDAGETRSLSGRAPKAGPRRAPGHRAHQERPGKGAQNLVRTHEKEPPVPRPTQPTDGAIPHARGPRRPRDLRGDATGLRQRQSSGARVLVRAHLLARQNGADRPPASPVSRRPSGLLDQPPRALGPVNLHAAEQAYLRTWSRAA